MSNLISFNETDFDNCVSSITDNAGKLKDSTLKDPGITCNSEGLRGFIEAMKGVQDTITAYENFVSSDMKRIQGLVENLKTQDMSAVIK